MSEQYPDKTELASEADSGRKKKMKTDRHTDIRIIIGIQYIYTV
jgi:hypothetical protein